MPVPKIPALVAHRGYPSRYPENTLPGIEAAIRAGAHYVEFDIQLSRDRIPVLCHDASLLRTAGLDLRVMEMSATELENVDVGEAGRFDTRFRGTRLPHLSQALSLLASRTTDVQAFVEIKQESIDYFGLATVVNAVMTEVNAGQAECIVISFNHECLNHARTLGARRIGWVTEQTDKQVGDILDALQPDFLFTSSECFGTLYRDFPGTWRWAVYHTEDPQQALSFAAQGAELVETNAIAELLAALAMEQA